MKDFIKFYNNPNEKDMRFKLIDKEYDDDIVEYIVNCCKSLEVLQNIKFVDYEYVTDESKINTSEYIESRNRGKTNKREVVRYMYTKDNRCAELRLRFRLTCDGETEYITKKILVPIPDENNYYLIRGTRYMLMYQIDRTVSPYSNIWL